MRGKHALVTGGGTGIGLAIAQSLAMAGVKVTITGRREDVLKQAAGDTMTPLVMDVTDETDVVRKITHAVEMNGPIQMCIANAGIAEGKTLQKTDMEFWRKIMSTNVDGAFLTIRESMRSMLETDWGRVIVISSMAGLKGLKGAGAYSASKHAVIGMIRTYAEEHVNDPITFNAICPGYVRTPIIDQNIARMMDRGMTEEAAMTTMVGANIHKRLIEPEEIAQTALWLCDENSSSVNGQTIQIAGGLV